jgi:tRNA/tmRNA/rRNA uracil-C5-methylase (TrmA/RlmC/RlmD family)
MGKVVQVLALIPEFKNCTSVFFQDWSSSSGAPPVNVIPKLVYGKPYIHETLNIPGIRPLTFRVQPTAFFQTNSPGCEILYGKIIDLCRQVAPPSDPFTVLDICCGTGTIGISAAAAFPSAKVFGVDIVEAAIQDAHHNQKLNQVDHAVFFADDARVAIRQLTAQLQPSSRRFAQEGDQSTA